MIILSYIKLNISLKLIPHVSFYLFNVAIRHIKNAHVHIIILLGSVDLLNSRDKYFNSTEGPGSIEQGTNDCEGCLQQRVVWTRSWQRRWTLPDG